MNNFNFDIISVALDLGSSLFKAAAGYKNEKGLVVIATEEEPSGGVKEGIIVNLNDAALHIGRLLKKLENRITNILKDQNCFPEKHTMSIEKVYVNISAGRTQATMSTIERYLGDSEILESTIDEMCEENNRRCQAQDKDFVFYTALPSRYLVDGLEAKKPVGMICEHIKVEFQNIWIKKGLTEKIRECIDRGAHIKNCEFVLSAKSVSDIVLSREEKENGVLLVNFGAQVTSVSVFKDREMKYLVELPKGSERITDDLCELQIPRDIAKKIKEQSCAVAAWEENENFHQTINGTSREFERWVIANIVEKRVEALFNSVEKAKNQTVWGKNVGLVVLTGGGSNLRFCAQKAQEVLGVNVRLGSIDIFRKRQKQARYMSAVLGLLMGNKGHSLRFDEIVEQKIVEEPKTAEEPKKKRQKKSSGLKEMVKKGKIAIQHTFLDLIFSEDTSKESDQF